MRADLHNKRRLIRRRDNKDRSRRIKDLYVPQKEATKWQEGDHRFRLFPAWLRGRPAWVLEKSQHVGSWELEIREDLLSFGRGAELMVKHGNWEFPDPPVPPVLMGD